MSLRYPSSLAFAMSSRIVVDALTEVFLLDRDLVEARDPAGLRPVDGTRAFGMPMKLVTTASGVCAYRGKPEEARKALLEAGLLEAPVAALPDGLVYATRDSTEGIRPVERLLHFWKDGRLFFVSRFPAEEDRYLGQADLPENLRTHFPPFDGDAGFACVQDPQMVSNWLTQVAKIDKDT